MSYKLTVLTVKTNAKVITDHAEDTAVKIRDERGALLYYEFCEGTPVPPQSVSTGGKWYVRVLNVTRGKFVGKRFRDEAKARARFSEAQGETRSYDTAFILYRPDGTVADYAFAYGEGDQLGTRPPNAAN